MHSSDMDSPSAFTLTPLQDLVNSPNSVLFNAMLMLPPTHDTVAAEMTLLFGLLLPWTFKEQVAGAALLLPTNTTARKPASKLQLSSHSTSRHIAYSKLQVSR
jgi:hypothetical protein